jgi:hypothetical protein
LFYPKYLYNQIKQEAVKHYWVKVFYAISPAVAEALAIRWVVSQALDIMEAITKPNENQVWEIDQIVRDIRDMVSSLVNSYFSFCWIRRDFNVVSDSLAKRPLRCNLMVFCLREISPKWLELLWAGIPNFLFFFSFFFF